LKIWGSYSHTDEGETMVVNVQKVWEEFLRDHSSYSTKRHSTVQFCYEYETAIPERALQISPEIKERLPTNLRDLDEKMGTEEGYKEIRSVLEEVVRNKCQSSLAEKFSRQRRRFIRGESKDGTLSKPTPFTRKEGEKVFEEFEKYYESEMTNAMNTLINNMLGQINKFLDA